MKRAEGWTPNEVRPTTQRASLSWTKKLTVDGNELPVLETSFELREILCSEMKKRKKRVTRRRRNVWPSYSVHSTFNLELLRSYQRLLLIWPFLSNRLRGSAAKQQQTNWWSSAKISILLRSSSVCIPERPLRSEETLFAKEKAKLLIQKASGSGITASFVNQQDLRTTQFASAEESPAGIPSGNLCQEFAHWRRSPLFLNRANSI